jgi:hypothetical protein
MIGMPRSGTTVISEAVSAHECVAWFPNYMNFLPSFTLGCFFQRILTLPGIGFHLRGKKKQGGGWNSLLRRFLPHPVEAFPVWQLHCGKKMKFDYLLGQVASSDERRAITRVIRHMLLLQGKRRFFTKLTGPPRICYLNSIFNDAYFIHIIRDPRAVVRSLLNVSFWRNRGGLQKLWWKNGPDTDEIGLETPEGLVPCKLAALQWKNVLEVTWKESQLIDKKRYIEIRYEDYVREPHGILNDLMTKVELPPSSNVHRYLDSIGRPSDMNFKYKEHFSLDEIECIERITAFTAQKAGYLIG